MNQSGGCCRHLGPFVYHTQSIVRSRRCAKVMLCEPPKFSVPTVGALISRGSSRQKIGD